MYNIPILFIIFKRKDVALKSFESIRKIQPKKLYVAGDGPRSYIQGEAKKVEDTRQAILKAVDWDCEIHTLFQKENLGCCVGVYSAINWLFDNEDKGIIIEDDCVLRDSFYPFAEELLVRYKDDYRIGMIDAANYRQNISIPHSYGFSRYKSTNGWATWKRAWKLMDLNMNWRESAYEDSIIRNMGYKAKIYSYPFGEYDDRVKNEILKFGFDSILNQNNGSVNSKSDIFNINRIALVENANMKEKIKYKTLEVEWIEPKDYPKDGILKTVKAKVDPSIEKAKVFVSTYGWQDVKVNNGIIEIQLNKKLNLARNRVAISTDYYTISNKLLIK